MTGISPGPASTMLLAAGPVLSRGLGTGTLSLTGSLSRRPTGSSRPVGGGAAPTTAIGRPAWSWYPRCSMPLISANDIPRYLHALAEAQDTWRLLTAHVWVCLRAGLRRT